MNNAGIIAGIATFIVSLIGLFLAVRSEVRNQHTINLKRRLEEEKRYARIESRINILEERLERFENICGFFTDSGCFLSAYKYRETNEIE